MLLHIKLQTEFFKKLFGFVFFGAFPISRFKWSQNNGGDRQEIKKTRCPFSFCYFLLMLLRKLQIIIWALISLFCFFESLENNFLQKGVI